MFNENEIMKLDYIYELIESIENSVNASYEVLSNAVYDDPTKYQLALSFLNNAETNYVNYLYRVREIHAESDETYSFETSYAEFKFQLYNYVVEKDTNPSWLNSKKNGFVERSESLKGFISEVIGSFYESNRQ